MGPVIAAAIPLLSRLFGSAAGNVKDQRNVENNQRLAQQNSINDDILRRGQLQSTDQLNRAGLDLQRKSFTQQEPDTQARQAAQGSLLQRIQPLKMTGLSDRVSARMPKMNSIIDALGPEARQAGGLLAERGLSGLEAGPTPFEALAPLNLPPATVMALQKSGLLEKLLGGAGLAGSIMSGLGVGQSQTINGGTIDTRPPERNW